MALPFRITKLEDVKEEFRSLYVKNADGTFTLEVEGAVDKAKLDEFRDKNIQLLKDAEKFKDLNPEKYAELLELQRKREEKELLEKGEVDKVVEGRVKAMKEDFEKEKGVLTTSNTQMTRQLESLLIDNTVRAAATKTGVRPEAVDDVLLRAKTMFSIKDGKVVALDKDNKTVYGKDGTTPLGIEEWSTGLKGTAPHLYMDSKGSGTQHGSGSRQFNGADKISAIDRISKGASDVSNYDNA